MAKLTVKQATIEQIDDIAYLFNEYRVFYKQATDLNGAKQFILERFQQRDSVIFLVIDEEENKAIGFTQLYPSHSSVSMKRIWILNDLYVLESHRKQGVASLLLEEARSYGVLTNAARISLSTAINNETAQKLYEQKGYRKDNEYYHYSYELH
ncbi:GNAT family N-acetyltransferase [Paenibacillus camelliae]|uniref:GNAT family N-acetyltransferase n=1 Tax=Paenibacillus camelliae TaxID=512410 RepID=UPI00203B64F5|nr:GNAT family N-acetyltransferase [Paenibacillus camelliae]MCM3633658.1 GNAT family N-acetyltransferase [Paenibacillus camelliae]